MSRVFREILNVKSKVKISLGFITVLLLTLTYAGAQPALTDLQGMLVTNQVAIPPGWSTIANPFSRSSLVGVNLVTDNRVKTLFSKMPVGTQIRKFHLQTKRFSLNTFGRRGWSDPDELLNPGDGALIFNPTRKAIPVSFCTGFVQNGVSLDLPQGWSLVSCPEIDFQPAQPATLDGGFLILLASPVALDFSLPDIGFSPRPIFAYSFFPQDGDIVYTFNQLTQDFEKHTFRSASGWDSIPQVTDTESFLVHTKHPRQIGLYVSMYAW
jgi:hypothetical protein